MPFEKGHEGMGGRPPGSKNKMSLKLKEAIEAAFEMAGGEEYLAMLARREPAVFCSLLGKLLPKDVSIDVGRNLGQILDEILSKKGKKP